jgi:hypothetical protein
MDANPATHHGASAVAAGVACNGQAGEYDAVACTEQAGEYDAVTGDDAEVVAGSLIATDQ